MAKLDSSTPISKAKNLEYIESQLSSLDGFSSNGTSRKTSSRPSIHSSGYSPIDLRIQSFLSDYFSDTGTPPIQLPAQSFPLNQPGVGRILSIPEDRDEFLSDIVHSFRIKQGVLHNPKSDRRTTHGIFHVCEGGLSIPDDKKAVPKLTASRIFSEALKPSRDLMCLPYTSTRKLPMECWVTLYLRPIICPAVHGFTPEKTMEIKFFVPGALVSNLDFIENIFGNAGDPKLPLNDAGLDVEHWSGHTGCVVLAPHLIKLTKKSVGLPEWKDATLRQQRDGMCWKQENELYNEGNAFKLTCRDESGVIFTVIADNYYGYCKKEVKTQISYATNLFGLCEEEHAGGTLVFPSYDLGEEFSGSLHVKSLGHHYEQMISLFKDIMTPQPEGYAIDKNDPSILYVSEKAHFDLYRQSITWPWKGQTQQIKLLPTKIYIRPSGYKVQMIKPPGGRGWRIMGTVSEGTFCHKPSTVSGGGKSEISKPISDAIIQGPVFVSDFQRDFNLIRKLIKHDYSNRFKNKKIKDQRPILSSERSLGSVIKLLTVSKDYTPDYNRWLTSIPQHILELVFVVKRYYKPEWADSWQEHFSVDVINGVPGNELRCDNRKLVTSYLRVGFEQNGSWRVFGLRKDFLPATKIQTEDDISASVVVPKEALSHLNIDYDQNSYKFIINCERKLFQRPDDAIHRGYDKLTESDFCKPDNFISNFEPLTRQDALNLVDEAIGFDKYTLPVQEFVQEIVDSNKPAYFVSPAHPRIVDGKPTKNPRYLQMRPDLLDPQSVYISEMGTRLFRRIPTNIPVPFPVNAVLPGRRNNPPEPGVRSLAIFNPIHYLELPELFMELISSITGKSPSTTGAGSEGALTKAPFNALPPIIDLNNALISHALTGHDVFITSAGFVGPHFKVNHDISLLVPELWARMTVKERDARFLIKNGYLERIMDMKDTGDQVLASRLGWRITMSFAVTFFGRIFNHPYAVFTEKMLRPETQDWELFVDGVDNVVSAHQRAAECYFRDGTIESACPPLNALLHLMKDGVWKRKGLMSLEFRKLFSLKNMIQSEWYEKRISAQKEKEVGLWSKHEDYLKQKISKLSSSDAKLKAELKSRLDFSKMMLRKVSSTTFRISLRGSLGLQPSSPFTFTPPHSRKPVKKSQKKPLLQEA